MLSISPSPARQTCLLLSPPSCHGFHQDVGFRHARGQPPGRPGLCCSWECCPRRRNRPPRLHAGEDRTEQLQHGLACDCSHRWISARTRPPSRTSVPRRSHGRSALRVLTRLSCQARPSKTVVSGRLFYSLDASWTEPFVLVSHEGICLSTRAAQWRHDVRHILRCAVWRQGKAFNSRLEMQTAGCIASAATVALSRGTGTRTKIPIISSSPPSGICFISRRFLEFYLLVPFAPRNACSKQIVPVPTFVIGVMLRRLRQFSMCSGECALCNVVLCHSAFCKAIQLIMVQILSARGSQDRLFCKKCNTSSELCPVSSAPASRLAHPIKECEILFPGYPATMTMYSKGLSGFLVVFLRIGDSIRLAVNGSLGLVLPNVFLWYWRQLLWPSPGICAECIS